MELPKYSVFGVSKMYMFITLLWMIAITKGQDCSTTGSKVYDGYRYVIYHSGRTFSNTRTHCQDLEGDMAVIKSADQNNFISMFLNNDDGNYFIGLEDMDEDGNYAWIDGTSPGYDNWEEDNRLYAPNSKNVYEPYCAVMRSGTSANDQILGRWNRVACQSTRQHICQIPLAGGCRLKEIGDFQYLIQFAETATPTVARESCQEFGGDLAIINNEDVNTFVKALLVPFLTESGTQTCYWFGLQKRGGSFSWLDGTPLMYEDWKHGEPNPVDSWGCIGLDDGPSWYGHSSNDQYPYICERTRDFVITSKASYGGRDYFLSPSWLARSFSDAQTYCRYHGGDLALIKSPDVNTFLHQRFSAIERTFFIGLTDQVTEGTFTWIDGTPLQYLAWIAPEPNDANNEDCASLNPSRLHMGWNDNRCDGKQSFICERYHYFPEYKWSEMDGTLYYVSQSSKTSFYFARKFCQEQGGDLAQPRTEEINDHLIHLAAGNSYWFGLNILPYPTPDIFQWIDETPLADNQFPSWSDFDESLFENEKCVYQNGNNGWRKLPCGSYLRFACEKPPRPRPVPPIRLVSATPTPYGGGLENSSYLCLLGSEYEDVISLSTRRFFRLKQAVTFDSYEAPGVTSNVSSVALRQTLPPDTAQGFGFFECTSVTAGKRTSSPLGVLLSTRRLQPTNGRLTITVHIGDNVTLNVMSTTGIQDGNGIRWRRLIDFDWTGSSGSSIEESSNSLSHTIQFVSLLDAGVYVTFIDGTLEDHQYSFIRLIVKECPFGLWNPPSCDRMCDNCYNGGICHELSGTCICSPGHAGKNCLRARGRHKFGWDCEFECGAGKLLDKCAESQICLPDPYGCNCLAGYTGIYCNETCTDGWYGADCRQSCHCADGRDCDDATGECPGDCSGDWSGPACQVPSLCPTGYFGSDCSQKCNCRNGTACNKDTGYCDEVEGLCDVGYVMNSVRFPSSCMAFSGCYGSCSKTCHCSNDTDDCNFLTGNCISSKCHPRWMGGQCQTDRFQTISEKTNPGVAIFHCSYTTSPESNHSSEYVMAAARMLSSDHLIRYNSSYVSTTSINNSFLHEYFGKEEPIYCYVGKPEDPSGFAFVRLPPREFFVLPSYSGTPEIAESGYYHAVVSWRQWDPEIDTGDGPIVGYKIYVRLGTKVIYDEEVLPPGVGLPDSPLRVLSRRSTDNATEMVTYNVTELEAGSTYAIQIAAIRDGIKGEGQSGPILTITTESLPVSLTTSIPTDTSSQGGSQSGSSLVSAAAGGAVGAILFILIVIIVVIIVFKRRRNGTKSPVTGGIDHDIQSDLQDIPLDRVQRNRKMQDSQIDDCINASYVKGIHYNFLTTQMPMPSTVSDFCCMVLTNQPSTIVMLNDKIQADKSYAQYWSDQGKAKFGSYTVAILSTSSDDDMIVRQLMITSDRNTSHAVTQYQFLGWPSHVSDHRSGAWSLLKLIHAVKGSSDDKKEFPLLVHCLRDTGRTGVFCSALESIAKMEEGDSVDIFQTVRILRANRMQFVQTEEEYSLLYDVVNAYMSSKDYEQMPYPINDHAYGNVETEDYASDMLEPEEITYEITDLQDGCASTHVYSNTEMEKIGQSRVTKSQEKYSVYENMELKL